MARGSPIDHPNDLFGAGSLFQNASAGGRDQTAGIPSMPADRSLPKAVDDDRGDLPGPGPILQTTTDADTDRQRRSEIEAELRKPRAENRYWREPAMQDEYRDILGRMVAPRSPLPPRPGDPARKAEIEDAMREGRSGAYWRQGSTLPDEYRAILERQASLEPDEEPA
jgi:hypothetical protein